MGKKFIPNGDGEFMTMADNFARTVAKDPAGVGVDPADADTLIEAAAAYRAAYRAATTGGGRSRSTTAAKDAARETLEKIIRRLAHLIHANDKLDPQLLPGLNLKPRTRATKAAPCPIEPPRLRFVRALHEGNGATPAHELEFHAVDWTKRRPEGAVRLELFVDLIPPDEPIPAHPGANHHSRPWYLRSYTKSLIRLIPPMARVPMRVVYWGRWADASGNVGPFSATAVAWIEGGSHHLLAPALPGNKPVPVIEESPEARWEHRDRKYAVALLEAMDESFAVHMEEATALPPPREMPRLEGPAESEAA
jgi:hypothetical protein